jgi:hypothetical protein
MFILNGLIPESWDWVGCMVTKSYVLSRGRPSFTWLQGPCSNHQIRVSGAEGLYLGWSVTLVMLTVPPSVAWKVRFTCW